jgi:polyisoprenoid-binding protein YceI
MEHPREEFSMITTPSKQTPAVLTRWAVDPDHTVVDFAVKTFWGFATVRGHFDRFAGSYEMGPDGASIRLAIDADSLDTGNATRDRHLRSADFFHAAQHPLVRFASTRVVDAGDDTSTSRAISKRPERSCRSGSMRCFGQTTTNSRWRRPHRSTTARSG